MNSLQLYRCDLLDTLSIEECGAYIEKHYPKVSLSAVNWPSVAPYQPLCIVTGAYSEKYIYIHFVSREYGLRAVNTENLSPVADDSCVEFFVRTAPGKEYWNFEFNCIGAVNGSHRILRPDATRLTHEEIESIKRHSSCGTVPFGEKEGIHTWTLTAAIPRELIGLEKGNYLSHVFGNFYKCAGKAMNRHYLSWAPIKSEKPNFHLPEYFRHIYFD